MPEYYASPAGCALASFIEFCQENTQLKFEDLMAFHDREEHPRAESFIFASQLIALAYRVFSRSSEDFWKAYTAILLEIEQNRSATEPVQEAAVNFLLSVNRSSKVGVFGTSFTSLQAIEAAFTATPELELQVNLALAGAQERDFLQKVEQFRAVSFNFFLVPEGILAINSDVILTGAECIFKNGVLCRPGSLQLAICSRYFKKPFIVIAETSKMCDFSACSRNEAMQKYYQMVSTETKHIDQFQPCLTTEHECLIDSYDFVDFELISSVVTDVGVMSGAECHDYICELFLKE